MDDKKTPWLYRVIRALVRLFSPKYELRGADRLPDEPCVIVGNHCHMYGPIAAELYTPGPHDTWCAGEMMRLKEVPAYAYRDFWSQKPRALRWFYRLLSYLIAPLSVLVFNSAHTVAVYHDSRLISTYRESMKRLEAGSSLVIFPEHYGEHNNIVHDFQDKFVDLARFYYKKTGKALCFVPMYLAPRLGLMVYGEPIRFRPEAPIAQERRRICEALMDEISALAYALPAHTVIPYPNVSKKYYPRSVPLEAEAHAESSR